MCVYVAVCLCVSLQGLTRCMCIAVSMGKGLCLISIQSLHRLHQGTPWPAPLLSPSRSHSLPPLSASFCWTRTPQYKTKETSCVIKISATGNFLFFRVFSFLDFLSCQLKLLVQRNSSN